MLLVFFFKQKTAYDMRISDWSSDVCSSDLGLPVPVKSSCFFCAAMKPHEVQTLPAWCLRLIVLMEARAAPRLINVEGLRSEEHTSELQSLMRISYAVFCLKKKKKTNE